MPHADGPAPIPYFYAVYVLRSTIAHTSFYIGSTPNPPRRLRQHNGEIKGGAHRTSRKDKRPWEMMALVSGFPGTVAALRFEWALSHPHLTTHIPSEQRVVKRIAGTRHKRAYTPTSLVATMHLLLRAPVFSRWPLKVHLFARDLYGPWQKHVAKLPAEDHLREEIPVLTDFGPTQTDAMGEPLLPTSPAKSPRKKKSSEPAAATASPPQSPTKSPRKRKPAGEPAPPTQPLAPPSTPAPAPPWGIHILPIDYEHMREYITKANDVFAFERESRCLFCRHAMSPGKGLYVVCPNDGCESVGHLTCWSKHILEGEEKGKLPAKGRSSGTTHLIPVQGKCPTCREDARWEVMMKEMTLRLRGRKQIDALLNPKRKRKARGVVVDDKEDEEDKEEELYGDEKDESGHNEAEDSD